MSAVITFFVILLHLVGAARLVRNRFEGFEGVCSFLISLKTLMSLIPLMGSMTCEGATYVS